MSLYVSITLKVGEIMYRTGTVYRQAHMATLEAASNVPNGANAATAASMAASPLPKSTTPPRSVIWYINTQVDMVRKPDLGSESARLAVRFIKGNPGPMRVRKNKSANNGGQHHDEFGLALRNAGLEVYMLIIC